MMESAHVTRGQLDEVKKVAARLTSAMESLCVITDRNVERIERMRAVLKKEKRKRKEMEKRLNLLVEIKLYEGVFDTSSPSGSDMGSPPPSPIEPSLDN